jgi:PIN domain nuclease of toxin-antitoxin system
MSNHRDPFDRMLIAQAIAEDIMLVSADPMFRQYDVSMIWAASS